MFDTLGWNSIWGNHTKLQKRHFIGHPSLHWLTNSATLYHTSFQMCKPLRFAFNCLRSSHQQSQFKCETLCSLMNDHWVREKHWNKLWVSDFRPYYSIAIRSIIAPHNFRLFSHSISLIHMNVMALCTLGSVFLFFVSEN